MSIFGSRNKTTVGTSVTRVIEDRLLPDSIKTGAINAIMEHSSQSVEYAMDELVSGLATRMDRMNKYGRNGYLYGVPEAKSYTSVTGKDVVERAMEADVGLVDEVDYYHLRPMNLLHVGWMKLVNEYNYNSIENTLTVNEKTVYLSNLQAVVTESNLSELENGSMDRWGPLPTAGPTPEKRINFTGAYEKPPAFLVDPAAAADYVRLEVCWEEETSKIVEGVTVKNMTIKKEVMQLAVDGFSLTANYFQVRYLKDGKAGYWMYQLNSGLKPDVEAIFDSAPTDAGTYFPWAYFRFDKKPVTENKQSQDYLSTKKLLKTLGMDINDVSNAIHESPDIKDVEQAMMMAAVPANTENEMEQRYLFDFFTKHYMAEQAENMVPASSEAAALANVFNMLKEPTTIIIQDKRFKMALSFDRIIRRRVAGRIDGGEAGSALIRKNQYSSGTNVDKYNGKVVTVEGQSTDWTTGVATHYYRKQITENMYEELLVPRLKMVYWIWGDYTDTADENEIALLIPLDYSIIEGYSLIDREKLYGRSLHYIFNSRIVTKLKWYQTGIFRAVITVISIIVMYFNLAAGMKLLAATATIQAAIQLILIAAMKYLLVAVGVRLFVKLVGVRIAFIVAIIAAVVGMYQIIDAGSVAGAPWATELINVVTNMTKAISRQIGKEFDGLMEEAEEFEKYMDTKLELLDDALELLNGSNHLTPKIIWGETPDDFYQRTVHSGNIGMVGIEAVSSFVQMRLSLPKLTDTLGEFV